MVAEEVRSDLKLFCRAMQQYMMTHGKFGLVRGSRRGYSCDIIGIPIVSTNNHMEMEDGELDLISTFEGPKWSVAIGIKTTHIQYLSYTDKDAFERDFCNLKLAIM